MKLSLDLRTSLTQTLTPQQIQYLKLLQLPVLQLEQQVMQELEQNPMLEEIAPEESLGFEDYSEYSSPEAYDYTDTAPAPKDYDYDYDSDYHDDKMDHSKIEDSGDPFEFYKLLYQDDTPTRRGSLQNEDDDPEYFQIKDVVTISEEILQQLRLLNLSDEELLMAEQIIGNVDTDGYLRCDLNEIIDECNEIINDRNFDRLMQAEQDKNKTLVNHNLENPARAFDVSDSALLLAKVENNLKRTNGDFPADTLIDEELKIPAKVNHNNNNHNNGNGKATAPRLLKHVDRSMAECILGKIQLLDPPGFASRNVRECLTAQIKSLPKLNAPQKLALMILEESYEAFAMKHYPVIMKNLGVTDVYLREAIDVIRHLNPKPGYLEHFAEINTVIPDFIISKEEESNELIININDSRLPAIRLNQAYERLKKDTRSKAFNKETKDWIKTKYEDAKFLIQAIRQRKSTMLKVMTAIAQLQRDFFYNGPASLRPLIYKDVSEETGLDISTICRIVNGKYVQTEYGTFELKFFFSESLPSEDGDEVSTTVIKQIIKDIIDSEPKNKPYSDDKIGKDLQDKGYVIARRTVAKYREQLKIPVARLRKEL